MKAQTLKTLEILNHINQFETEGYVNSIFQTWVGEKRVSFSKFTPTESIEYRITTVKYTKQAFGSDDERTTTKIYPTEAKFIARINRLFN